MVCFFIYILWMVQFLITIQYEELEIKHLYCSKTIEQYDLVIYQFREEKEKEMFIYLSTTLGEPKLFGFHTNNITSMNIEADWKKRIMKLSLSVRRKMKMKGKSSCE